MVSESKSIMFVSKYLNNIVYVGKLKLEFPCKDYFRIIFCSDSMSNSNIKGSKLMCLGVEFIAFNVLLRIKSEQKVIGN